MKTASVPAVLHCAIVTIAMTLGACSGQATPPQPQLSAATSEPFTLATDAAFKGDLEYVKLCIESDPRYVQGVDGFGKTLLHYAAEGGHKDIVEYLIQNGASVFANDSDGYSPFDSATQGGASREIMEILTAAGNAG